MDYYSPSHMTTSYSVASTTNEVIDIGECYDYEHDFMHTHTSSLLESMF